MDGITFVPSFVTDPQALFGLPDREADRDLSMASRKIRFRKTDDETVQHAIPAQPGAAARKSLTFRHILAT